MFKEMKEKVLHRQLSKYMEENKNLKSENTNLQARIVAMQALVENAKDYINANEKMRREMLTAKLEYEKAHKELLILRKEYDSSFLSRNSAVLITTKKDE